MKEDGLIVGDIEIKNIVISRKSNKDKGLRRNFYNQSLCIYKNMLNYKSIKFGKEIHFTNEKNTSKTCRCCGYLNYELELSDRVFVCPNCGKVIDRDQNSAINHEDVWLGQFKSIKNLNLCV